MVRPTMLRIKESNTLIIIGAMFLFGYNASIEAKRKVRTKSPKLIMDRLKAFLMYFILMYYNDPAKKS